MIFRPNSMRIMIATTAILIAEGINIVLLLLLVFQYPIDLTTSVASLKCD